MAAAAPAAALGADRPARPYAPSLPRRRHRRYSAGPACRRLCLAPAPAVGCGRVAPPPSAQPRTSLDRARPWPRDAYRPGPTRARLRPGSAGMSGARWRTWAAPDWEASAPTDPEAILAADLGDRYYAKQGRSTARWRLGDRLIVYLKRHHRESRWLGLLAHSG